MDEPAKNALLSKTTQGAVGAYITTLTATGMPTTAEGWWTVGIATLLLVYTIIGRIKAKKPLNLF